jgi:hypothetical protein
MRLSLLSRTLIIAVLVLGTWVLGENTRASDTQYDTPEAAVEATLAEMLSDWNVVGECDPQITPVPSSVCYYGPSDMEGYLLYGADAFQVTEAGWWIGVVEVDGGWKPYGAGRCDLFYCRLAAPDDEVLFGHPNGNVDCINGTSSQDALMVLQFAAALITLQDLQCWGSGDVYPGHGIGVLDALAILQSEAGLIGALPVIQFQFAS